MRKRIVLIASAVALVVVATLAFLSQHRNLVRAREVVAKRDLFCEWHRRFLGSVQGAIETGLARSGDADGFTRDDAAQLESANRTFQQYQPLDLILQLCGTVDPATTSLLQLAGPCWTVSHRPDCFRDAAKAVVRDLSR